MNSSSSEIPNGKVFNASSIRTLSSSYSLCLTGPALSFLQAEEEEDKAGISFSSLLKNIAPFISIFARVSPTQKELILHALKDAKCYTLMCGDGTNDVGALKAAHVGVSIVNDPDFESKFDQVKGEGGKKVKGKGSSVKDRAARAMAELQVRVPYILFSI